MHVVIVLTGVSDLSQELEDRIFRHAGQPNRAIDRVAFDKRSQYLNLAGTRQSVHNNTH